MVLLSLVITGMAEEGNQTPSNETPEINDLPTPPLPQMPTYTPAPAETPLTITPAPTIAPTPAPKEEKFRVGPSIDLKPIERVIDKDRDGLVELYMNNSMVNDVALTVEAEIKVPAGIHVYGTGFGTGTAGVMHGIFTVEPGMAKGVQVRIKADESARIGENTIVFSGIYYPGDNKDLYNIMSLTYPVMVDEPSKDVTTRRRCLERWRIKRKDT